MSANARACVGSHLTLWVQVTKELVTLRLPLDVAPFTDTAHHMTPHEFHAALAAAAAGDDSRTVLLDTRNLYESRLGTFAAPGVYAPSPHSLGVSRTACSLGSMMNAAMENVNTTCCCSCCSLLLLVPLLTLLLLLLLLLQLFLVSSITVHPPLPLAVVVQVCPPSWLALGSLVTFRRGWTHTRTRSGASECSCSVQAA